MSSLTAPPLWNVAWGLFFHPTSATLSFLMTTSVPFAGSGTTASFLKLAFACLSVCAVLNHVYHLLVPLGISLEVQDTLFISGVALGVLPSLICVSRCFFLELPRKQAVLLTVLNVFIVTVWPVRCRLAARRRGPFPATRSRNRCSRRMPSACRKNSRPACLAFPSTSRPRAGRLPRSTWPPSSGSSR